MAKILFITATNTNIGKTYASTKIIERLSNAGLKVGASKPIETGVDTIPQDAYKLLTAVKKNNVNFRDFTPFDITAYSFSLPSAPFVADSNGIINISKIIDKIVQLKSLCDVLIVEGAGGLMVPIKKDYFMLGFIKDFRNGQKRLLTWVKATLKAYLGLPYLIGGKLNSSNLEGFLRRKA